MELPQEFIEKNQLTEDQATAIKGVVSEHIKAELGSQVHEHTESNLSKIWKSVNEITGIEREQGEKYADALKRASSLYFEGKSSDLERKINEYDEKIKNAKGDEVLKSELEKAQNDLLELKDIASEHEEWKKKDYKGKYEESVIKLTKTEQRNAFNKIRPNRPDSVNKFEWDARWKEFESSVLESNDIKFDENDIAWAVDKDSDWKKTKLEDLYKQNETLQELAKGREQKGLGSKDAKQVEIDGVPFKLKENATPGERQKAIKEYLAGQNISQTSNDYAKEYARINAAILGLGKKPAKKE